MAMTHMAPGQARSVRPLAQQLRDSKTAALFKSQDLEVIRLVLRAGSGVPPHKVSGEMTIHCLEGCLELRIDDALVRLYPGELLFLKRLQRHALQAVEDSSALITMVLHHAH